MLSPFNTVKNSRHCLHRAVARRLTWTTVLAAALISVGGSARGQTAPDLNKPASATWINQNQTSDPFRIPGGNTPNHPGAMPSGAMPLSDEGGQEPATDGELNYFDRKGPALPADCCKSCPSFWYGQMEAVFVDRKDSNLGQVTQSLSLGEFDFHTGARLTVGRQADCLEALEFVYTGINNWENSASITSAVPNLQSIFNTGAGINFDDFDNAISQSVTYETNFNSFELNRRRWGWDIISTVFGFRYINLEEQFNLVSSPGPTFGQYNVKANNNIFGFQVGGDMLYPIGPGMNIAAKGKLGLFGNAASQTTRLTNDSQLVLINGDDKLDYSVLLELGGYATYRVRPRFTLKAGYEFWYLWNAALATEQVNFNISPATGAYLRTDGNLVLTAFTVGGEFQW